MKALRFFSKRNIVEPLLLFLRFLPFSFINPSLNYTWKMRDFGIFESICVHFSEFIHDVIYYCNNNKIKTKTWTKNAEKILNAAKCKLCR
jgi:hypothetical protein